MEKTFAFLGATLGGWVGWALGSPLSLLAGLGLSLVGLVGGTWLGDRMTGAGS